MKLRGKSNFSTDYGKSNDPDGVRSYYRWFFEFFRTEARSIFRFQFFRFFLFFFSPPFFTKLSFNSFYTLVEYERDDRYRFHKLTVPSRRYRNEDTFAYARSSSRSSSSLAAATFRFTNEHSGRSHDRSPLFGQVSEGRALENKMLEFTVGGW